jgi:prepilin-type processing-associated H-X9-DG protein
MKNIMSCVGEGSWRPWLRCARARGARGFTLLELLTVFAILVTLAALLLPALTHAKAKARRIDCLSRQKQLVYAFRLYVDDEENGLIPREGFEPTGEVVLNNWSQIEGYALPSGGRSTDDVWYNALPKLLHRPATYYYSYPPRMRDFYERANIIQCPSARFPRDAYRLNNQFALFSLAMNSHLIRAGEGPSIGFQLIENHAPSRMVLFLDNRLEGERMVHPMQDVSNLGQPSSYASRFGARHEKGGNLGFADGHVQWFRGEKVVEMNNRSVLRGGPIVPPKDIVWELPYR